VGELWVSLRGEGSSDNKKLVVMLEKEFSSGPLGGYNGQLVGCGSEIEK